MLHLVCCHCPACLYCNDDDGATAGDQVKAGTGGLNASRHHWKDQEEGSSTTSSTGLEMAAVSSVASQ